jgi:predicted nuclease of predicted toxin-antitoxin system
LRFLLDEDLPPKAAEIARNLGLDVMSVHEVSRRGYADDEQLRFSAGEGCIFVTRNRDDFLLLTVEFHRAGEPYRGVLIVSRSLPNDRPERISHALKRWVEARASARESFDGVDFL